MFTITQNEESRYSFLSLFSGAGGLDLGFEKAGFKHMQSTDILECAVETIKLNRPGWDVLKCDVKEYMPPTQSPDVLLAGFPCQGFSLGGNRDETDARNQLYRHVVRIASLSSPRVIVMENVLNLRTMKVPQTGRPFSDQICADLQGIGYKTIYDFFRMSDFGVPQTRRRFIFIAYKDSLPDNFFFPHPEGRTPTGAFLSDLSGCFNHEPSWGYRSTVHVETNAPYPDDEMPVPVRLSRTASDGTPIRDCRFPFPAVDTATIWGWAVGNVQAERMEKNRTGREAAFVRNPASRVKLWRIRASKIREFTPREYARLQTFPDDWRFTGKTKRDLHLQIGNAVPVVFAKKIAECVRTSLEEIDGGGEIKQRVVPRKRAEMLSLI